MSDNIEDEFDDNMAECQFCGRIYSIGNDGNELGFCMECQKRPDFPYDIEAYYKDYDEGKVAFKGFETMSRGLLERYRHKCETDCGNRGDILFMDLRNPTLKYRLCANCILMLVTRSLSPDEFKALIKNGHSPDEFDLHDDFYDAETGRAFQPMFERQ